MAGAPLNAALQEPMAEEEILHREPRDAVTQRVRVGLTGLAAVFLLTLLAAAVFSLLGQDEQHDTRVAAGGGRVTNVASADDLPKEPLAELGIAPGGNLPKASPDAKGQAAPAAMAPTPATAPRPAQANPALAPAPHN
jgi:hypothetical protein